MADPTPPDDAAAQQRRYRIFMAVESILLLLTVVAFGGLLRLRIHVLWLDEVRVCFLAILSMWHIVAIPICFMYLIGNPVVMSLSPLVPSPETRAIRRQLRERPALTDDEFFARFYEGSGIARDVPTRVRECLHDVYPTMERVIPSDFVYRLDDEVDYADVLYRIERTFGFCFTKEEMQSVDGTLDNLIRLVDSRTKAEVG